MSNSLSTARQSRAALVAEQWLGRCCKRIGRHSDAKWFAIVFPFRKGSVSIPTFIGLIPANARYLMSGPGEGRVRRLVLIVAPHQLFVTTLSRQLVNAHLGRNSCLDSACPLRILFRYSPDTGAAVKNHFVSCPCGDVAPNTPSNLLRQQLVVGADGIVNWLSFVSRMPSRPANRNI